jgi:3-methyladenine DNA glycosylase Tag
MDAPEATHHAPQQIEPKSLGDYLEVMSKAIFQTGISWKVVEAKWPGIREAFHNFDHRAVASLTEGDLATLSTDTRVIRNRRKIEAIVDNARLMLDLEEEHGGFQSYLRSHDNFEACAADLRKKFKFMGDTGAFYFLYVVGEEVPPYEDWCASRGRQAMGAH